MKASDYRNLSTEELIQKEKGSKKELFDLNYQRKMGQVEHPSKFRSLKRNIARILTVIREREIENDRSDNTAKI